jgi:O-antigen ligase/tetratricopeptide (TPR) repeat protein
LKATAPATSWWRVDPTEAGRALLFAHLVLSPLLFSRDTVDAFEQPKIAFTVFTALILAALGITSWLGATSELSWSERSRRLLKTLRDPLVLGVLFFLVSALASTVVSISPRMSFRGAPSSEFGLLTIGVYAIVFFATRWLCRDQADAERLLAALLVTASVTAAHAASQVSFCDPIPWEELSRLDHYIRPFATMGHPNFLAGYLVMVVPIVMLFADRAMLERRWWGLGMLVFISGAVILAIVAACSRGAWLALACTLLVIGLGWIILGRGKRAGIVLFTALPLVIGGVVLVCTLTPGGGAMLWGLTKRAYLFTYAGSRREIWSIAWNLFRAHPWLGCGVDTFHLAFGQKRTVAFWMTEWNTTAERAHNEILQILATQGLLGIGAALWMVVGLGMTIVHAWRRTGREQRVLLVAVVAGLVGYAVQVCFSFTVAGQGTLLVTFAGILSALTRSEVGERDFAHPGGVATKQYFGFALVGAGVLFAILFLHNIDPLLLKIAPRMAFGVIIVLAALVLGSIVTWRAGSVSDRSEPSTGCDLRSLTLPARLRITQITVWFAGLLLIYALVIQPLRASFACRDGDRLLGTDLEGAIDAYARAIAICPEDDFYHARLGAAVRDNVARARTLEERQRLVERGRQAFGRAAALVPSNAYYHLGLGRLWMEMCRIHQARPDQALDEYDRALALDENNAIYYADAANAALVLEDLRRAHAYAEQGCQRYPHFGMLRAELGYVAYMDRRYDEAVALIAAALRENWYREENGRRFADMMLMKARAKAVASHAHASPGN